jgi:glutamine cyclotransferase
MNISKRTVALALAALWLTGCGGDEEQKSEVTTTPVQTYARQLNYSVEAQLRHDTTAYTEGLLVHNGKLYESTGADPDYPQTRSLWGEADPEKGTIAVKAELDKSIFGEGIVFLNNKVYQLTYKNQVGYIYDAKTFRKLGEFKYENKEGWGLTTDSASLIMSDGTSKLTYFDPATLQAVKVLPVTDNGNEVTYLNELEYIKGFIYANVFETNQVVKIDPASGQVVARLDLTGLKAQANALYNRSQVLNGIAYDPATDRVYVTGKLWPVVYAIRFEH